MNRDVDHHHEPLTSTDAEQDEVTDLWELVEQVCKRHGISMAHEIAPSFAAREIT